MNQQSIIKNTDRDDFALLLFLRSSFLFCYFVLKRPALKNRRVHFHFFFSFILPVLTFVSLSQPFC